MHKCGSVFFAGLFLLAGMHLGNGQVTGGVGAQQVAKSIGPRYEYKVVNVENYEQQLEQRITEVTKDDWEIAGVVNGVSSNPGFAVRKGDSVGALTVRTKVQLILKREKR